MLQMLFNMLRSQHGDTMRQHVLRIFCYARTCVPFSCLQHVYIPFHGRLYICREGGSRAALSFDVYICIFRFLSASVRR